jgi:yqaC
MKRLHDRSFQLFGYRMLNGRDLYEQEKKFFKKVESKTEEDVKVWLANM